MSAKFQYLSDIHLETHTFPHQTWSKIKPCAPYLIIAGDLGNVFDQWYKRFLSEVSSQFKYVFLISGNHEYYYVKGHFISDTDQWMSYVDQEIEKITKGFKNVIFLQNKLFLIPDTHIAVYGTTLWSDILDDERSDIRKYINDYNKIPNFTTGKSSQLYRQNVKKLLSALDDHPDYKFIVISHHLPSYDLIASKYLNCGLNSAFTSQIELAKREQILAWVAGHTHAPKQLGKFYVNPIGYFGEISDPDFYKIFNVGGPIYFYFH